MVKSMLTKISTSKRKYVQPTNSHVKSLSVMLPDFNLEYIFCSRGTLMCNAFTRVCPQCPTATGQNWYFWSGYSWRYAGNALTVVEG